MAKAKKQRRGRIRKAGEREPNGRLRRESVAERMASTVHARMRQHGLTLAQSGERLAGYEIGRLYLRHEIDLVDVEVCDDYVQTVARHMVIVNPLHPFPKAMDYLAAKGQGGDVSPEQALRARVAYGNWIKALEQADSRARMTFHGVAFFDYPVGGGLAQVKECIAALRKAFR